MATTLQERLATALSQIRNPRTGAGVYESQQLRDIATTVDGKVRATLQLDASDDPRSHDRCVARSRACPA